MVTADNISDDDLSISLVDIIKANNLLHKDTTNEKARAIIKIMMNEKNMVDEVRKWISVNDKYNLYQFICPSYFDDLIVFLKTQYTTSDVDDLASEMTDMTLGSDDSVDGVNESMSTLKIDD
jgi:hypothetical protein